MLCVVVARASLLGMQKTPTSSIKAQRLRRGWTLRQLSAECAKRGVEANFGQLSRIERHIHTPNPALRAVLAELLGLDVVADFETDHGHRSAP